MRVTLFAVCWLFVCWLDSFKYSLAHATHNLFGEMTKNEPTLMMQQREMLFAMLRLVSVSVCAQGRRMCVCDEVSRGCGLFEVLGTTESRLAGRQLFLPPCVVLAAASAVLVERRSPNVF